jgi:HEAT repeat protein
MNISTLTGARGGSAAQLGKNEHVQPEGVNIMRSSLLLTLAVCAMLTVGSAQQTPAPAPTRAELLAQLRSDDSGVRSSAVDQLRSDPAALRDPKVKVALVNLLDRENNETFSEEEEDYANYVDWLSDTVAKVVDWNDPHQVCVLANSADIPDELANHAKIAVPCLLQRFKNVQHALRGRVVAAMVQALAKGRTDLDAPTIQAVQQAMVTALHDPESGVRIDTVDALEKFGREDMIPALKVVAAKDPESSEGYWVRKRASEAITAIQKRTGQQQQ